MLTIEKDTFVMNCDYSNKKAVMKRFRCSFSEGVGSILSLQGGYIRLPLGSAHTDEKKLQSDWEAVCRELRTAYKSISDNSNSSNHGKVKRKAKR